MSSQLITVEKKFGGSTTGQLVFISFMLLRMGAFGGIAEYQNL